MPIDFPNSPTNGDSYTADSRTWVFNGTSWVLVQNDAPVATGSVTEAKIADGAVTSAKIANGAVTSGKIASNAVSQAKLASNLSAVTITTSSNRSTDVPSPFNGQMILETDTFKMKVWNGSTWLTITVAPPAAPTSLSAVPSSTSVAISFTPGSDNGAYITNHEYAISTNGGSSYGAWTTLSPADATSPITVSGLTAGTAYYVKLRSVNATGGGTESSPVSFTTLTTPNAPTGLSVSATTSSSLTIAFTAPSSDGGAAITNYEYSINGGSSWTALSPADSTTPVTVTGLTQSTSYTVYLRAVNSVGSGTSSSGVSGTTAAAIVSVEYLVIAGGGGGAYNGGGGGAGGYRCSVSGELTGGGGSAESPLSMTTGTYTVTIGAGDPSYAGTGRGQNSVFASITSTGGGSGGGDVGSNVFLGGATGGSGGGGGYTGFGGGGAGGRVTNPIQGNIGSGSSNGGGGGAGSAGSGGSGGAGLASSITGSSVTRAVGGAGSGGASGAANTGNGGAGNQANQWGGTGGSGIVICRYLTSQAAGLTITGGTKTTSGSYTIHTFTSSTTFVIA